jgi:hypothetical protein
VKRRRVVALPSAEFDYFAILVYLEEQRPGLAERFAAAFRERIVHLRTDALWPVVEKKRGLRSLPLDRPWEKYALIFTLTDDEVQIRAVVHLARNLKRYLRDR